MSQRFFGAHKFRRTAFAGDYTGLRSSARSSGGRASWTSPCSTAYITRLLTHDGAVFGAYGFRPRQRHPPLIHADAVISRPAVTPAHLAAHVVAPRREHPGDSSGWRSRPAPGCATRELVQSPPSGIIEPENAAGTLVASARGEGGILRNALGERYMTRYDPERMELSTRDRVALGLYTEIERRPRHRPKRRCLARRPHLPARRSCSGSVCQTLLELQMLDITRDPIEVPRPRPTTRWAGPGAS
ncbi:FAD-binding protein [Streptomyces sp. KL116D]|uniref:FAD-binding protein n=1 Tax=Streptomyces sp. KL116D TaxID=3045152 RepID=UPI003557D143